MSPLSPQDTPAEEGATEPVGVEAHDASANLGGFDLDLDLFTDVETGNDSRTVFQGLEDIDIIELFEYCRAVANRLRGMPPPAIHIP